MSETTPTTTKPKASKAPATPADPAGALHAAIDTLVVAADAYTQAYPGTVHSFAAGDFRVRFQSGQLLSLARA